MKHRRMNAALILLVSLALPGAGGAQEVVVWSPSWDRGWLGLQLTYSTTIIGQTEQTVAFINRVEEGGPADSAGVQAGDTITHLDGRPSSQRGFLNLREALKPGDMVKLTLLREGRVREVTLEAEPWPSEGALIVAPRLGNTVMHLDTIQQTILAELDEMRLQIGAVSLDSMPARLSLSILRSPPGEEAEEVTVHVRNLASTFESLNFFPEEYLFAPDLALPFEALVARSPATDSLRARQARIRRDLNELRRLEQTRIQEIRGSRAGIAEEVASSDERIRELRAREAELVEEEALLFDRIRRISETEIRERALRLQAQQEELLARNESTRERSRQELEEARRTWENAAADYTRIYALGRGRALGAEFKTLNSDLAPYFGVDHGILVVEVAEGTPAAEVDLRGGDVIVVVGGDPVSSVEELKFGLTYLQRPLQIQVIRNREPVNIYLRK